MIAILLLAGIGLLYSIRGTPVRSVRAPGMQGALPGTDDPVFRRTMELFTGTPLLDGNRVEVFTNGDDTYPGLWADLRSRRAFASRCRCTTASRGGWPTRFSDIIRERAHAGVRVLFLRRCVRVAARCTEEYLE